MALANNITQSTNNCRSCMQRLNSVETYLFSRGLGKPLRAVIKALASFGKAAASGDVTDR